jgi:acetyltransferase-like isoleucine patch superfamily enzyme
MRALPNDSSPILDIHPTAIIHPTVLFFGYGVISVKQQSRIDAYSVITSGPAGVKIGKWVHIGSHVAIHGGGGPVRIEDGVSLSGRVTLYTSNDDFSGGDLIGPTFADKFRHVENDAVTLEQCVAVGVGSVVLPGVTMFRGAACGALCVVRKNVSAGDVVAGNPQQVITKRNLPRLEELWQRHCDDKPQEGAE